jgi:hypothetical protein
LRGITVETSAQYCNSRTSSVGVLIHTSFYGSISDQSVVVAGIGQRIL